MLFLQVSELLSHIAPDIPEAIELVQLLQCHHFKVRYKHLSIAF